ncbi:hypothetical protein XH80_25275 [Bradyrhizobium sp. CCBAU 45384]|nr:hypothetical protein [Bradyrhizobium sp. CCBAU 45384]
MPLGDDVERYRRSQHLSENLFSLSKRLEPSLPDREHMVNGLERLRTMRDNHDNAAALTNVHNCFGQRLFTVRIQIRGRLVEHDQEGISIERACKSNTLSLTGRQCHAALPDFRAVGVGKREDEIMHACRARRFQDPPNTTSVARPRDRALSALAELVRCC